MRSEIFYILFIFIVSYQIVLGQVDPIEHAANILPASPTATELGRYGLIPVGYNTGTPNIDLPLHDFNVRSLALPISLSYNSNGIKVDQVASWVGMGWSLNAGGVITRIVRDEADDEASPYPYPASMLRTDVEAAKYLELASQSGFDSERDLYSFNFLGYSGKFVFDRNGNPIIQPLQNIKIQRFLSEGTSYFVITASDGIKYFFEATETTRTFSQGSGCGKSYDLPVITSWFLTKIENALGDVIYLEYKPTVYTYKSNVSQVMMRNTNSTTCSGTASCPTFPDKTCVTQLNIIGVTLSRIYSPNHGEVVFNSEKTRSDIDDFELNEIVIKDCADSILRTITLVYTDSYSSDDFRNSLTTEELRYRSFLTSLVEKNSAGTGVRAHHFSYNNINNLPPRLAFSQDHWGYFNGADNTYLLPEYNAAEHPTGNKLFPNVNGNREPDSASSSIGILNKIIYPTGGHTQFHFEPNTYWGTYEDYPDEVHKVIGVTGIDPWVAVTEEFTFANPFNQEIYVTANASQDPNSQIRLDPLHHFARLDIEDLTSGTYVVQNARMEVGDGFQTYIDLEENHTYKFSITAQGDVVDASLRFDYYPTAPLPVTTNIQTGGVRIKKIVSYDPVKNATKETNYLYAKVSEPGKSTGKIGNLPRYYNTNSLLQPCGSPCAAGTCSYGSLYSNSQVSLYPVNGNHIYYEYVTVYEGPDFTNGAEEHQFIIQFDQPGYIVTGQHINDAPASNFGWGNGLEKSTRFYSYKSNAFIMIKEITNNYIRDMRYENSVPNLVVRKRYSPICTTDVTVECDASNINYTANISTCVTSHSHLWATGGFPFNTDGETICVAPGALNQEEVRYSHPCNGRLEGEPVIVSSAIDHLDAIEYKNTAYWFYNESRTEKTYDENGGNPVTEVFQFFYDNPEHTFLSKTIVTGSDSVPRQTAYWYPQDYASPGNVNALRENNILNKPIKTEQTVGNNQVSGSVIEYTEKGLPKDVYQYRSHELTVPAAHDPDVILPSSKYEWIGGLNYSVSNNIIGVVSITSPPTGYIYDYSDSRPVAKIINASETNVSYTSFESDGKGNWDFTGATYNDISARTGSHYYKLSGGNISRNLNPGEYLLEFWAKGSVAVLGGADLKSTSSPDANGWVLYSYTIDAVASTMVELTGGVGSLIDELKLFPSYAQVSTYTYKDGIGISSQTDPNNLTVYYDYDLFGRLKTIRDSDGNIMKDYQYHYDVSE